MTRPLQGGWAIVAPADALVLARLVRAGAESFRHRRKLSQHEADVVMLAEQAASDARASVAGSTATQGAPVPGSWVPVERAAEVLDVSTSRVRQLCRTGKLVAERHGGAWHVDPEALAALALRRETAA